MFIRPPAGVWYRHQEFPDAYLKVYDLSHGDVAYFREDIAIPLEPYFGTMGVCPAGAIA